MGAEAAGLQDGDVITTLGGRKIKGFTDLQLAVAPHKGGDTVEVELYRDGEKMTLAVQLSRRPVPDFPPPPKEAADELSRVFSDLDDELDALFANVSEAEAAASPEPGEWSAKEALVHLVENERWNHRAMEAAVAGQKNPGFIPDQNLERVMAQTYSTAELVAALKRAEAITVALTESLPEELMKQKGRYFNLLANRIEGISDHHREHFEQIGRAIQAARKKDE